MSIERSKSQLHSKDKVFHNLMVMAWVFCLFYMVLYYEINARIALYAIMLGVFVLIPMAFVLKAKGYRNFSRMTFLFFSNFVLIYGTSLGLKHEADIYLWYVPSGMASLLLFETSEAVYLGVGIAMPVICWVITALFGYEFVSKELLAANTYHIIFSLINFVGSFSFSMLGIYMFVREVRSLQKIANERYDELMNQSFHLQQAQKVARLGNWSYSLVDGLMVWSEQMNEIYGIKPLGGVPDAYEILQYMHEEDRPHWLNLTKTLATEGGVFSHRFRILRPSENGEMELRWLESKGQAIKNEYGKIDGVFGTTQDITEEVLLQEKLSHERAKAIQNSKLASLGEMAAGVAHEINNPLVVIRGLSEIMPEYADDVSKIESSSEKIRKACDRISKIVLGLRKFSRSTENKEYKTHNLVDILNEVFTLADLKAKKNFTELQKAFEGEFYIRCDEIEIEQVLLNLINNAIDAVHANEKKWVRAEIDSIDDKIFVRIIDSGHGIPEKIRAKLFDPFFTTKVVGEGTGLGLSIAKGIIEDHKANLRVRTDWPNTCFEITFNKEHVASKAS